jgi:S-adenosylmethionine decarboxylase
MYLDVLRIFFSKYLLLWDRFLCNLYILLFRVKASDMIGLHLIVDGVSVEPIRNFVVKEILTELPGKIGMKIIAGPIIVAGEPENPGWTGFVIIDKSHISIHTFEIGNLISIDVFSCKPFDVENVKKYLFKTLKLERLNIQLLQRSEA